MENNDSVHFWEAGEQVANEDIVLHDIQQDMTGVEMISSEKSKHKDQGGSPCPDKYCSCSNGPPKQAGQSCHSS